MKINNKLKMTSIKTKYLTKIEFEYLIKKFKDKR